MNHSSFATLLCFLLVACSGGGSSASSTAIGGGSSSLTDFCSDLCDRAHTCDNTQDVQTCTSSCQNENAAQLPKLRSDLVSSIESCLPSKDCATVLANNALGECSDEAIASLSPTSDGTAFCDAWSAAETTCDKTLDKASCLSIAKQYNDATLQQAQSCTTQSCSSIVTCLDAVLGNSVGGGSSGSGG